MVYLPTFNVKTILKNQQNERKNTVGPMDPN